MFRRFLVLLALCGTVRADRITDLMGPYIPMGESPWPAYDIALQATVDLAAPAALAYVPELGAALPGTYTLVDAYPVTLVGTMAPGVSTNDQIVVAWNGPDGMGTGRMFGHVISVMGNTITFSVFNDDNIPLPPQVNSGTGLTGLTVYACARCVVDIVDPTYMTGQYVYTCGSWGLCALGGNNWLSYDPGLSLYRTYQRTGDSAYLTAFRNFTDTWYLWALNQAAKDGINPPRGAALASQFIRALDGESQRFESLHTLILANVTFNVGAWPSGQDNREPGYMLIFAAMGARADSDPTRHASYCDMVSDLTNMWLPIQQPNGSWSEKNNFYPYAMPGVSPWRMFSVMQGLARAHDVLIDTTSEGCNDTALAADIVTALEAAGAFVYNYGYDPMERAAFYDAGYPNNGRDYVTVSPQGTGCVVTSGSANISCPSATLQSDFNCNGTDYIGIEDMFGTSYAGLLNSCPTQTTGVLSANWGGPMQTIYSYAGPASAGSYTGITYDVGMTRTLASSTSCGGAMTPTCLGFGASLQPGFEDRSGNFDIIWIMGWLYHTTGDAIWKTRGDEVFSAAYGAAADGPGGTDPCGGPGCDGYEAFAPSLTGCAFMGAPCNDFTNYPGNINAYGAGGRTWGQVDGIGGGGNYLAWRLGDTVISGTGMQGNVSIKGNVVVK